MLYKVEVVEVTTLWIEAESEAEATRSAGGDYIWGPDQDAPNRYEMHIDIEEVSDGSCDKTACA
jgi:hypothetical protein